MACLGRGHHGRRVAEAGGNSGATGTLQMALSPHSSLCGNRLLWSIYFVPLALAPKVHLRHWSKVERAVRTEEKERDGHVLGSFSL